MVISVKQLRIHLENDFESLVRLWFPDGRAAGTSEYLIRHPTRPGASLGSFSISFPRRLGFDFASGDFFDIINLFALSRGITNGQAIKELASQHIFERVQRDDATHSAEKSEVPNLPNLPNLPNVAPRAFQISRMCHKHLGRPEKIYEYRDVRGQLIGYVARFCCHTDGEEWTKKVLAMSWSMHQGTMGWHWDEKGWNGTKPIYGAQKISMNPTEVALIVEGEKACDAAQRLFPHTICLSWRGGAGCAGKVDWGMLQDRTVVIWPDSDIPGITAARSIARSIPSAKIITPPSWKDPGWDLADAESERIDRSKLIKYIFACTGINCR